VKLSRQTATSMPRGFRIDVFKSGRLLCSLPDSLLIQSRIT
jgi:hypothetical protein